MRFEEFEVRAWQDWERVPHEFKTGIDELLIERDGRAHPSQDEIYTLGECITESFPSEFSGPETTRSRIVLYYGSFLRLSMLDREFDWEKELWETLTHELQHHLESLATEDGLEDYDYAVDHNFKRQDGAEFDPFFFRAGEPIEDGAFAVEPDVFLEVETRDGAIEFEFNLQRFRVMVPKQTTDVTFARVENGPELPDGDFFLVLVAPRSKLNQIKDALRPRKLVVSEVAVSAELLPDSTKTNR